MIPNDQVPKTVHIVSGGNVTQFSYDFYAPDTANVYVLVDGSAVSSGWTASSASTSEGMVVFDEPVVSGATVTVYRSTPMVQTVDLGQGSSFYPQVITDALDNVVMGMQELRGGTVNIPGAGIESAVYAARAGSASSAGYATYAGYAYSAGLALELDSSAVAASAGHATTAAGLDDDVIVSSAAHATTADSATTANGTEFATSAGYAFSAGFAVASGGTANYASSAGSASSAGYAAAAGYATNAGEADSAGQAGSASALTDDAKADILSSAGGKYDGPFAVTSIGTNPYSAGAVEVAINGGHVVANGSADTVPAISSGYIYIPDGGAMYLHGSSGTSAEYDFTSSAPATFPQNEFYTALAENSGGILKQVQYGDIVMVPWGASGGGGSVDAFVTSMAWGTQHSATADGLILAQVYMSPSSVPGETAYVAIGSNVYYLATVPQSGLSSEGYCCARMLPVASGQTWSAHGLNYAADNQLYFLALSGGTMSVN